MLAEPSLVDRPYEVLKVVVGGRARVLVLSTLCGVNTHFFARSLICGGGVCEACKSGIASKYAGYVAVSWQGRRRLLRLTSTSAQLGLDDGAFQPGLVIEVEKAKDRQPLNVIVVEFEKSFDSGAVVAPISLLSIVARLHGLPAVGDEMSVSAGRAAVEEAARFHLRVAMQMAGC